MSPQKLSFVITYLLEDEQELSLGMLIRCKRIYNFWCSMLVYCQLLYVLLVLLGVFMDFLWLTYWQDAKVPVPCFLLFLIPEKLQRKYSRNWTKLDGSPYFTRRLQKPEGEEQGGHRGPTPCPGAGTPLAAPRAGVAHLAHLWLRPSAYLFTPTWKP